MEEGDDQLDPGGNTPNQSLRRPKIVPFEPKPAVFTTPDEAPRSQCH